MFTMAVRVRLVFFVPDGILGRPVDAFGKFLRFDGNRPFHELGYVIAFVEILVVVGGLLWNDEGFPASSVLVEVSEVEAREAAIVASAAE